jgi:hypothetical protein
MCSHNFLSSDGFFILKFFEKILRKNDNDLSRRGRKRGELSIIKNDEIKNSTSSW